MTDIEKIEFLREAIGNIKGEKTSTDFNRSTLLESLKIDSLDAVELQMYYEDKTGIETKDPTSPVKTVGDLIDLMP